MRTKLSVIQDIIDALHAQQYLEIGVETGMVFFKIKAPKKFAVDPRFIFSNRRKNRFINYFFYGNHEFFFEETSNFFFSRYKHLFDKKKVSVAFIDGLHTYQQVYQDVQNVLEIMQPGGVILVDDCNPPSAIIETPVVNSITEVLGKNKKGELHGWTGSWTGDVWKAIIRIQSERNDLNIFTLDIDFGVAVILKGKNQNKLDLSIQEISQLTYNDLSRNRVKWLNLKSPDYIDEVLPLLGVLD